MKKDEKWEELKDWLDCFDVVAQAWGEVQENPRIARMARHLMGKVRMKMDELESVGRGLN